jgi:hypothetical protein
MPTNGSGPEGANSIVIKDEGVIVDGGPFTSIDIVGVGAAVNCFVDGEATITVSGGGGGGGGGTSGQVFNYTVLGSELDLSELTITLPVAELSSAYLVIPAQAQATYQLTMNVQTSGKTLVDFVLSLSNVATAGDIFSFWVVQP